MNVIPCTTWVRRGVAAAVPDKIQLTSQELESIIKQTASELQELDDDSEPEDGTSAGRNKKVKRPTTETTSDANEMVIDEYNFGNYDNEADDIHCTIGGLASIDANGKDPFVTIRDSEDEDSEKEDDVIKPDDNLVLIGHVEGDASILEIFVYNEKEGSFYCHHDILLPSFPLCLEWLSFDPSDSKPANLCAMGNMTPIIDVWDLDLVDCLEPAFKLGNKKSKKQGHRDAVLDIAWNQNFTHILASGSVDKTALLWDLETLKAATKLIPFGDRVQAIQFHPTEAQHLLTGCADGIVRLFDCKNQNEPKCWQTAGEVERVLWNHFDPNYCFIGTSTGVIECIDVRQEKHVWQIAAHEKEITGLSLSSSCPGLLVSSASDGVVKIWDALNAEELELVCEKNMNLGDLQCLAPSPDSPFIFAIGGDNKSHNFKVWDILESEKVSQRFKQRGTDATAARDVDRKAVMEVVQDVEDMSLNVGASTSSKKKSNK